MPALFSFLASAGPIPVSLVRSSPLVVLLVAAVLLALLAAGLAAAFFGAAVFFAVVVVAGAAALGLAGALVGDLTTSGEVTVGCGWAGCSGGVASGAAFLGGGRWVLTLLETR